MATANRTVTLAYSTVLVTLKGILSHTILAITSNVSLLRCPSIGRIL